MVHNHLFDKATKNAKIKRLNTLNPIVCRNNILGVLKQRKFIFKESGNLRHNKIEIIR